MEKKEIEAIVREVLARWEGFPEKDGESSHNLFRKGGAESDYNPFMQEAADSNRNLPTQSSPIPTSTLPGLVDANGGRVHITMPLALAVKLIEKVEAKAAQWDMRVVTAVSDAAGRPVAVHCMDGAYIGSFDVALNKTYTSIAFQMSTAQLGSLSGPGGSLYGIQFTNEGKIVIFGGGEVLERNGIILGALGVSGGSAEQDTALAAYGKSIFQQL